MASPPGPSLGSGEQVLFSGHAVHKKVLGTVWFTSRKAVWLATDAKAAVQRVELSWAAVKSFQVQCDFKYQTSRSLSVMCLQSVTSLDSPCCRCLFSKWAVRQSTDSH